jgi:hypothetical protein
VSFVGVFRQTLRWMCARRRLATLGGSQNIWIAKCVGFCICMSIQYVGFTEEWFVVSVAAAAADFRRNLANKRAKDARNADVDVDDDDDDDDESIGTATFTRGGAA